MNRAATLVLGLILLSRPLTAQSGGSIEGLVTEVLNHHAIPGAVVSLDGGVQGGVTDAAGRYFIRDVAGLRRRHAVGGGRERTGGRGRICRGHCQAVGINNSKT